MQAFIKFNKGMMKMPIHWQFWLMSLVATNMIIPLFYLDRLESQVVVGAIVASLILMTALTGLSGFGRLLGLGHIVWIPLLYLLWTRLGQIPADDFFGIWIRVLMALNATSLIIDATDVIRYLAGDREETVKGL